MMDRISDRLCDAVARELDAIVIEATGHSKTELVKLGKSGRLTLNVWPDNSHTYVVDGTSVLTVMPLKIARISEHGRHMIEARQQYALHKDGVAQPYDSVVAVAPTNPLSDSDAVGQSDGRKPKD